MQENEGSFHSAESSVNIENQTPFFKPLICAILSVVMMNFGFFSFFFLAPLGYAAAAYNSAWLALALTVIINSVFSLITRFSLQLGTSGMLMNILFITSMSVCFVWIIDKKFAQVRTAFRIISASAAAALLFLVFIINNRDNSVFNEMVLMQAELLFSTVVPSTDAARQSFLLQTMTPEKILEILRNITLRGGALVSAFFLFFINRQVVFTAVRIIRKQKQQRSLLDFFAPDYTIWVFSSALAVILLTRSIRIIIPEILAWNILVICVILFMAQGAGIVLFFLAGRTRTFRLAVNILIIITIFSPLSTIALAALLLLGIAENWLPLRQPKNAPTPGQ